MAASCERLGSECWHLMAFLYTIFPAKQDAAEGGDSQESQEAGVDSISLLSGGALDRTRRGRQQSLDESKDDEVCSPSISIESQTPSGSPERSESPERTRGGGGRADTASPLLSMYGMFKLPALEEEDSVEGATLQSQPPEFIEAGDMMTFTSPFMSPSRDEEQRLLDASNRDLNPNPNPDCDGDAIADADDYSDARSRATSGHSDARSRATSGGDGYSDARSRALSRDGGDG